MNQDFESIKSQIGIATAMLQTATLKNQTLDNLWDTEFQVFSQWGEDGIINFLCDRLNIAKPNCFEIGTEDFSESNTRFLAHYRNSRIFAVDSDSKLNEWVNNSPLKWRTNFMSKQLFVTVENINNLYAEALHFLGEINLLSIDVDGVDYWLLRALENINPQIIIVEYNALFGGKFDITIPYSEDFDRSKAHFSYLYYGASLRAFVELLEERNFILVGVNRACNNAFFVPKDLYNLISIKNKGIMEEYLKVNFRESRDVKGNLSYLNKIQSQKLIENEMVLNISTNEIAQLKNYLEA